MVSVRKVYTCVIFNYLCICFTFPDLGSQDCYDIPRSFPSDKSCSFEFSENFNSYFVSVFAQLSKKKRLLSLLV